MAYSDALEMCCVHTLLWPSVTSKVCFLCCVFSMSINSVLLSCFRAAQGRVKHKVKIQKSNQAPASWLQQVASTQWFPRVPSGNRSALRFVHCNICADVQHGSVFASLQVPLPKASRPCKYVVVYQKPSQPSLLGWRQGFAPQSKAVKHKLRWAPFPC